jgi:hypothetical protein
MTKIELKDIKIISSSSLSFETEKINEHGNKNNWK